MPWETKKDVTCPVEITLQAISGRWKVMILYHLFERTYRFNELSRVLRGVTARTLTVQLRELETDGLIRRQVYPEIPPRVEYSLTELGKTLEPVLAAMHKWGEGYPTKLQV